MKTPLEKAQKDPDSTKAKILTAARKVFGEYGFHGTTTRMIAKEAGIDISTLHYHWGEKGELYEAAILDMNNDLGQQLRDVEKVIHNFPLGERMKLSLDILIDYLFEHPEISNLLLYRYFGKTRQEAKIDFKVPEFTADIARSMGLSKDKNNVSPEAKMKVLFVMNAIHNFVSGENFFRSMVHQDREEYIKMVKETLKFALIPAFTAKQP